MGDVRLLPGSHHGGVYRLGEMEVIEADNGWCPLRLGYCVGVGDGFEFGAFLGKTDPPSTCEHFAGSYRDNNGKTVVVCRCPDL
jgi:hypothetical protein